VSARRSCAPRPHARRISALPGLLVRVRYFVNTGPTRLRKGREGSRSSVRSWQPIRWIALAVLFGVGWFADARTALATIAYVQSAEKDPNTSNLNTLDQSDGDIPGGSDGRQSECRSHRLG
jgi:hypothetical protein